MRGALPHGWEPDSRFLGLQCSWRISSWFRYDWEEGVRTSGFCICYAVSDPSGQNRTEQNRTEPPTAIRLSRYGSAAPGRRHIPSSPAGSESFDPRGQPIPQPTLPSSRDKRSPHAPPHLCCLNMPKHPHACICHYMTVVTWEIQLQDTRDILQLLNEKNRERLRPLKHGRNSVVRGLDAESLWFPGGERLRPGAV